MSNENRELDAIRAQISKASHRDTADVVVSGKLELPVSASPVVVRFNSEAHVEFSADAIVAHSIAAFSRTEIRGVLKRDDERGLGVRDWFHLKLKHGASCTLHYKTIAVKIVLDRAIQKPFYIDTNTVTCVYLEKGISKHDELKQISCDEYSEDRDNKEVKIYYKHPCCCTDKELPTYGFVSCDDGWRDPRCG